MYDRPENSSYRQTGWIFDKQIWYVNGQRRCTMLHNTSRTWEENICFEVHPKQPHQKLPKGSSKNILTLVSCWWSTTSKNPQVSNNRSYRLLGKPFPSDKKFSQAAFHAAVIHYHGCVAVTRTVATANAFMFSAWGSCIERWRRSSR